jgi:hypothetical protein
MAEVYIVGRSGTSATIRSPAYQTTDVPEYTFLVPRLTMSPVFIEYFNITNTPVPKGGTIGVV